MHKICKKDNINIIHCNIHRETLAAKKVAKKYNVKIVLTRHNPQTPKAKYLKNLDGFIGVNPQIATIGKNKKFNIKKSIFIPPIFDEEKFLNFKPSYNKENFFKKNFNLDLQNLPVLCMVANMPLNINHKNHPLLLNALAKLINEKNIKVNTLLIGDGPKKSELKVKTKKLNIEKYVHFLGFTDKVAEILYHSDINILTSKEEGLPIVISEAALLKKTSIVGTDTPMTNIILHKKTGLVFKYNDIDSLVQKIEQLLDNPKLCKTLGENVYQYVKENFTTECSIKKIKKFYEKVLQS